MQVVGYDTVEGALLLSDDGRESDADAIPDADAGERVERAVERLALDAGAELAYRLGDRHCAGTVHDGVHIPCDEPEAPYCPSHQSTWVCARCTGTCLKDEMDCHEDHAIYLAAFAPDVFKVGVTRHWRLETRLREQGADRAAHVRTVEDGRIARKIEAQLADDHGITDRVRLPVKRRGLHEPVDVDAWDALVAEFDPVDTYTFDYGFDVTDRPVAETLATGTVRGTKGRLLVLDHGGTTYAVDVRDLVGYEVTPGATGRNLQSSLGAFG